VEYGGRVAVFSAAYLAIKARTISSSERYATLRPSQCTRVVPFAKSVRQTTPAFTATR